MASSPPSLSAISGHHHALYETLWNIADRKNGGSIGALDAANLLKKSKLSDSILGKIWDLSDRSGKGTRAYSALRKTLIYLVFH